MGSRCGRRRGRCGGGHRAGQWWTAAYATAADPPASTIAATGSARGSVHAPRHQTNKSIERAVQAARKRALPDALAAARADVANVGAAVGLRPGRVVGARRDGAPLGGYWDQDSGTFGPGKWCGKDFTGRRTVRRAGGSCSPTGIAAHFDGRGEGARRGVRIESWGWP